MSAITPYVLPSGLINSPTGIDWSTLPYPGAGAALQTAVQYQMCIRATHAAEAFCNQVLRATINTQVEDVPHKRAWVDLATGVTHFLTEQWPVLAVVSAQYSPAATFPRSWTTLTSTQYDLGYAVPVNTGSAIPGGAAQGGNVIDLAPGLIGWWYGRKGFRVQIQYLNGWPHCGITGAVTQGATTLNVDDVTGYTIATSTLPVVATIEDGLSTEAVNVIATNPSGLTAQGPGTVTLATGTAFAHNGLSNGVASCTLTTMPATIQKAVVWLAISESLVRGTTTIEVPALPGSEVHGGGDAALDMLAYEALLPYKRVIHHETLFTETIAYNITHGRKDVSHLW